MRSRSRSVVIYARSGVERFIATVLVLVMVMFPPVAGAVTHPAIKDFAAEPPTSIFTTRAAFAGTVLSPTIEQAYLDDKGMGVSTVADKRPFPKAVMPKSLDIVLPYPGKKPPKGVGQLSRSERQAIVDEAHAMRLQETLDPEVKVNVWFENKKGLLPPEGPRIVAKLSDIEPPPGGSGPKGSGPKGSRPPKGGMVYLSGGKLFPSQEAAHIAGGTLVACTANADELCVAPPHGADELATGLMIDRVLQETWKHVYVDLSDALYLSIDPTKRSLRSDHSGWPSNRLDNEKKHNRVVVKPEELRNEEVGTILYEADVLFKSAGLGFDVLAGKGHSLAGFGSQRQMVQAVLDGKTPQKGGPSRRYCRFYWGSEPAMIGIDGDRVTIDGAGVAAHAEAMVVKGDKLEPFPSGSWCAGGRKIARQLTQRVDKIARSGTPVAREAPFDVLPRLIDVSRKQAFLTWAHDADITTDSTLEARLRAPAASVVAPVPEWTSGIRTNAKTHVRLDLRQQWKPTLRIYGEDDQSPLVAGLKSELEVEELHHFRKWERLEAEKGRDLTPEEAQVWLKARKKALRAQVKGMGKRTGIAREPTWNPSKEWEWGGEEEVNLAIATKFHPIPVSAHGGVLLHAANAQDPSAPLSSPTGGRLFLSEGDDLHFWAAHPGGDIDVEHLELRGFEVDSRVARDGIVRFLLRAWKNRPQRGLHETRLAKQHAGRDVDATEWVRSLPLGGRTENSAFYSQGTGGLEVRRVELSRVASSSGEGRALVDAARIKVFRVSSGTLLVEVDASHLRSAFDERWKAIAARKDVLGAVGHLSQMARLGFYDAAKDRLDITVGWLGDDGGALEDKVMEAGLGIALDGMNGELLLIMGTFMSGAEEAAFELASFADEERRLSSTKAAKRLLRELRLAVDVLPPHLRGLARQTLVAAYDELAKARNRKAVRDLVRKELAAQREQLEIDDLLRNGTSSDRV